MYVKQLEMNRISICPSTISICSVRVTYPMASVRIMLLFRLNERGENHTAFLGLLKIYCSRNAVNTLLWNCQCHLNIWSRLQRVLHCLPPFTQMNSGIHQLTRRIYSSLPFANSSLVKALRLSGIGSDGGGIVWSKRNFCTDCT